MTGRCPTSVVLSVALLIGIPASAVAQGSSPPGSASAVGAAVLEAKVKAVAALERANGELAATLSDPAYPRLVAAVRSLLAAWPDYVSRECELVGTSTLAASPWQSTYVVQCEATLTEWRAGQVAAATECLKTGGTDFLTCVRPLT